MPAARFAPAISRQEAFPPLLWDPTQGSRRCISPPASTSHGSIQSLSHWSPPLPWGGWGFSQCTPPLAGGGVGKKTTEVTRCQAPEKIFWFFFHVCSFVVKFALNLRVADPPPLAGGVVTDWKKSEGLGFGTVSVTPPRGLWLKKNVVGDPPPPICKFGPAQVLYSARPPPPGSASRAGWWNFFFQRPA